MVDFLGGTFEAHPSSLEVLRPRFSLAASTKGKSENPFIIIPILRGSFSGGMDSYDSESRRILQHHYFRELQDLHILQRSDFKILAKTRHIFGNFEKNENLFSQIHKISIITASSMYFRGQNED